MGCGAAAAWEGGELGEVVECEFVVESYEFCDVEIFFVINKYLNE